MAVTTFNAMKDKVARLLLLVVPDDHGGMGHTEVGYAVRIGRTYEAEWTEGDVRYRGAFASVRNLGDWTGYAVTESDGTLVYAPEGVWRHARRDPSFWDL